MSKTKTQLQKVKELLLERVNASIAAGYRIDYGQWADEYENSHFCNCPNCDQNVKGTRCAVGAIAFNGKKLPQSLDCGDDMTNKTFALAGKQLMGVGVPEEEVGDVLDAISAGFEDEDTHDVSSYSMLKNGMLLGGYPIPKRYMPYYNLGQMIRKKYCSE